MLHGTKKLVFFSFDKVHKMHLRCNTLLFRITQIQSYSSAYCALVCDKGRICLCDSVNQLLSEKFKLSMGESNNNMEHIEWSELFTRLHHINRLRGCALWFLQNFFTIYMLLYLNIFTTSHKFDSKTLPMHTILSHYNLQEN